VLSNFAEGITMSRKNIYFLLLVAIGVSSCAPMPLSTADMAAKPTGVLCAIYATQSHPNYYDYRIKNILASRGQDECTTPQGMATQRAIAAQEFQQSMQMLQYSNQLMQMGQPRVLAPPPSQPINCVSRAQGNQVVTNCN
jgi:hypothetical protein